MGHMGLWKDHGRSSQNSAQVLLVSRQLCTSCPCANAHPPHTQPRPPRCRARSPQLLAHASILTSAARRVAYCEFLEVRSNIIIPGPQNRGSRGE